MTLFRTLLQLNIVDLSLGDIGGGETPGPIPNPEVKPVSADGTWLETAWESRSLPRGFSVKSAYQSSSIYQGLLSLVNGFG